MNNKNLSELFSSKIFRTPDYQRGYAWVDKQLNELWDDLDEIPIDENGKYKSHYTGTIILKEIKPNSDEEWYEGEAKFYDVVDGQQRLTTISILLFELLKAMEKGYRDIDKKKLLEKYIVESNSSGQSEIYKFCYSNTNQNYQFLQHSIFENPKVILPADHPNHYTENLLFAKTFFAGKIKELTLEGKEVLYKKLTNSLLFDIRIVENDLDVQAVFETMNNRGKPLSTLEKLKNRLIYLTTKLPDPSEDIENLRTKINEAWGVIYTWLAKEPSNILPEDIFLSSHLSLYRNPEESTFSETMAEKKVFEMFCNKAEKHKEDAVTYTKIADYIVSLSNLAPIWYEIHNMQSKLIRQILTLDSRKDIKIFLAAIINEKTEKQEEIFMGIEKILFRNGIPGIWLMDERKMATWARDIYQKNKKKNLTIDELKEDDKNLTIDDLLKEIEHYIAQPINNLNLITGFKNLFTYERGQKGFHRWGCLKYFLFEYENHLKKEAKEPNDKVTLDDFNSTTIEHIIPQSWQDNWQKEVKEVTKKLKDDYKIEQARKVIINTLGNLTILKDEKNSSVGKDSWKDKRKRYTTGSYNEIAISKYEQWDKISIKKRGINMLNFLEIKVSGLKFLDSEMDNVLFYDEYIIERINN